MRQSAALTFICLAFHLISCGNEETGRTAIAATVFHNGTIYAGSGLDGGGAIAVAADGTILELAASLQELTAERDTATELIDLKGAWLMPGFIEGHGHFSGLGSSLRNLNFLKSKSWDEIVGQVAERAKTAPKEEWITGRGWHQEKWDKPHDHSIGGYPIHDALSELTRDNPVLLAHASGHSLYANARAMELAGVSRETPDPRGGRIVRDAAGDPIGVFEERAMELITGVYQEYLQSLSEEDRYAEWRAGIDAAQEECLRKGITSFQDAGSSYREIAWYRDLAENGELDLRLWAMLRHRLPEIRDPRMDQLPIIDAGDGFFTCRAIKSEVDGALGSYGAWLLEPYADKVGFTGQNTTPLADVDTIAGLAARHNLQLCVHAIGDRANREVLDLFEKHLAGREDHRWRIEHAQHLHPDDIARFGPLGVIAAMQGIHCTSDALFAETRLGEQRAREGAYPWRALLDAGAIVVNGTDAPVEDVDPLESFYASVTRRRADRDLVFFPEQAMTREEAIESYTLAAAFAAFEDGWKGSLEPGKVADFTVLSRNLLTCADEDILRTEVLMTVVDGKVRYERK